MRTTDAPTTPRAHSWRPLARRVPAGRVARASLLVPVLAIPILAIPILAARAPAQLIGIKTVPIADGDQFNIYPSKNLGMAGVSIAVADSLLDPFVNPATGARVRSGMVHGSPVLYSVSHNAGGGRTLPLGALVRRGAWFGGLSLALQQVDPARRTQGFVAERVGPAVAVDVLPAPAPLPQVNTVARPRTNQYAFGLVGTELPRLGVSIAGSASYADLHAVDGTELLYANSAALAQSGDVVDLRMGLLKGWRADRSLQLLVLHNRYRMAHDVTYLDVFWDPARRGANTRPRFEHNADRTNVWGLQTKYERPLAAGGWRIGWLATGNVQTHPKIPEYRILAMPSIPRDPGRSYALNLGVGLSRRDGPSTFGLDAIYEPIRSTTWADAAEPTQTVLGATIPPGGRTVENWFRFSNAIVRMGFGQTAPLDPLHTSTVGFQLGVDVHSIRYRLEQLDRVQDRRRFQNESWVEWAPTWGLSLTFPELEVRYTGRTTHGTGRPGVAPQGFAVTGTLQAAAATRNILVAPDGPLTLDAVSVTTHQISLSLPIR